MTQHVRFYALNSGEVYDSITPTFHAIFGLLMLANAAMIVLTVVIILQTARCYRDLLTSTGQEMVMEVQKTVILMAVCYCLSNIPAAVVYYLRASKICTHDESHRVPLRTTQAAFHIINSGANFFIYVAVSPGFRKHFLNVLGLARFVGGGCVSQASSVPMTQVATAEI